MTAPDPSFSEPIKQAPKYNPDDIIGEIKAVLAKRGTLGIRGLGRLFRILDNNGNRQLDIKEIQYGLADFGIDLNEERAQVVLNAFDRDRSGTVDYNEFLRVLRGDLNPFRLSLIRKAYEKLDVNKDGLVKLDDIAKLYNV